jgi:hypothetical protein
LSRQKTTLSHTPCKQNQGVILTKLQLPNKRVKHTLPPIYMILAAGVSIMLSAIVKNLNRDKWISEAAYYKALARGFEPHEEVKDWLEAEQDYLYMLVHFQLNVLEEDGTISTMGLRQIAESLGVQNLQEMRFEFELIHAIQEASRHNRCFQSTESKNCAEISCHWKSKCNRLVAVWHR